jgi:hypothetical protein
VYKLTQGEFKMAEYTITTRRLAEIAGCSMRTIYTALQTSGNFWGMKPRRTRGNTGLLLWPEDAAEILERERRGFRVPEAA